MTTVMKTKAGKPAPNQLVHTTKTGVYLQSYQSLVAYVPHSGSSSALLGEDWNRSRTTLRYVRQFLADFGMSPEGLSVADLEVK